MRKMRETKFRAWSESFGLSESFKIGGYPVFRDGATMPYWSSLAVIEQFTGLHDKNGKEIYEGDICKIWFDVSKVEDYIYNSLTKEEQEAAERIFIVESPLFNSQQELNADQIEIIGNVHEQQS
jgi:hypothetical protein